MDPRRDARAQEPARPREIDRAQAVQDLAVIAEVLMRNRDVVPEVKRKLMEWGLWPRAAGESLACGSNGGSSSDPKGGSDGGSVGDTNGDANGSSSDPKGGSDGGSVGDTNGDASRDPDSDTSDSNVRLASSPDPLAQGDALPAGSSESTGNSDANSTLRCESDGGSLRATDGGDNTDVGSSTLGLWKDGFNNGVDPVAGRDASRRGQLADSYESFGRVSSDDARSGLSVGDSTASVLARGANCFPAHAAVMAEGVGSPKAVGALASGQRILCYDLLGCRIRPVEVVDVRRCPEEAKWVDVELDDGTTARLSPDYPMHAVGLLPHQQVVRARKLVPGTCSVLVHRGSTKPVLVRAVKRVRLPAPVGGVLLTVRRPDRYAILLAASSSGGRVSPASDAREHASFVAAGGGDLVPRILMKRGTFLDDVTQELPLRQRAERPWPASSGCLPLCPSHSESSESDVHLALRHASSSPSLRADSSDSTCVSESSGSCDMDDVEVLLPWTSDSGNVASAHGSLAALMRARASVASEGH